jgi:hypothetical protein
MHRSSHLIAIVSLKKDGIEKEGRSNEQTLMGHGRSLLKVNFKGIGFGKNFRHERLGLLENLGHVWSITSRVGLGRGEDAEGHLATSLATGVTLGTAIDTTSTTARRRMNLVYSIAILI